MRAGLLAIAALALAACQTTQTASPRPTPIHPSAPAPVEATTLAVEDVQPDAEVDAMLAPFGAEVAERSRRVVGQLAAPMKRDRGESSLGNFVADAMREGIVEDTGKKTDLCFTNTGGLRRDLPAGEINAGLVTELMPFDNGVVVFEMRRGALEKLLDQIARRTDPVSGVTFTRTPKGQASSILIDGRPVEDRRYRICTSDYLFEGGGGYAFDGADDITYTGVLLRDLIMRAFERHKGPIQPPPVGRVKRGNG